MPSHGCGTSPISQEIGPYDIAPIHTVEEFYGDRSHAAEAKGGATELAEVTRWGRPVKFFDGPWKRAIHALARPDLIPHDLRRSFARNATNAGVPRQKIKAIAGWKTDDMFYRYSIVDEGDMAKALEKIYQSTTKRG